MPDTIRGPVTNIVDGDTFDMTVIDTGSNNKYKYDNSERIRIASIDAPELQTRAGKRSKEMLEKKLKGKMVHCQVQSRDAYRRIVADVSVL